MLAHVQPQSVIADGVALAAVSAGIPSAPTIVFVHGYPDTKEIWDEVLTRLADRFELIAYDVRGAGGSSAPRGPAAYDLVHLADDFAAVCDALAPGRPVHLVGHDWGAIQGWEFACSPRFAGRLASFTAIAGPALHDAVSAGAGPLSRARLPVALVRLRRSWYVLALCAPLGPTIAWRVLLAGGRWRAMLAAVERLPVDDEHPSPTVAADGLHGANLYRRNIPRRVLRPRPVAPVHTPVQLIVPTGDRFISESYYERAERSAPGLRRRVVSGSHWVPRSQPDLVAEWVAEFVTETTSGRRSDLRPWVRGGGVSQLPGRRALVTGAGSGIGRATALALANRGARLLLVDRDGEAAARVADLIPGATTFQCDVGDEAAMHALAAEVLAEHGVVQIVVNNAGIAVAGPFLDTDFDHWRRVLDTNLLGVVHGSKLFAAAMVANGSGGQIVNVSSAAAFAPSRDLSAYSASKAAVLALSQSLRAEYAGHGIGVSAICPGFVATNITRATTYAGRPESEQERLREHVTRLYERRNFGPDRVADAIVAAIAADRPLAVVTPEAKVMHALSRLAPGVLRRLARVQTPGI